MLDDICMGKRSKGKDNEIFVTKRDGSGWTLNFRRPEAWLLLVIVVIIIVAFDLHRHSK